MADNINFEEFFDKIKERSNELYTAGRKIAIEESPLLKKLWKSEIFRITLLVIGIGIALYVGCLWLDSKFHNKGPMNGVVPANVSRPLIDFSRSPIPNLDRRVEIETEQLVDGKNVAKQVNIYFDEDEDAFVESENYDKVKIIERNTKVDFTFRFGIGVLFNPLAKDTKDIADPALFISPMIFFERFSLDGFVGMREAGGGISYRLPFRKFKNTFIGGGMAFPFNGDERNGVAYLKVNF